MLSSPWRMGRVGWYWSWPPRFGRSEHEYWTRYLCGPFYLLRGRKEFRDAH